MASYLFPGSMYNRFLKVNSRYQWKLNSEDLSSKYHIYQQNLLQYLGFGGVLQFIPGSQAFRARIKFSNEISSFLRDGRKRLHQACVEQGPQYMISERLHKKGLAQQLHSVINVSPVYFFFREFLLGRVFKV